MEFETQKKVNYAAVDVCRDIHGYRFMWRGTINGEPSGGDDYDVGSLVRLLAAYRVRYVFTADVFILYALDKYAYDLNLPRFDNLNDGTGKKKKLTTEAYGYKDSDIASYSRRIWLRAKNRLDPHKREGIVSVTFLDFSNMTGGGANLELLNGTTLWDKILTFNKMFERLVGRPYLGVKRPAAWTIGGAAKSYYLTLKYGDNVGGKLKKYQAEHPINKDLDDDLRLNGALMSGLIYVKDTQPHDDPRNGIIFKIDANSAFPYINRQEGEIYISQISNKATNIGADDAEYLYLIDNFYARVRRGEPALYGDVIIKDRAYLFSDWINCISQCYDILDFEIKKIYRIYHREDFAIRKYVNNLYKVKSEAEEPDLRAVAKYLLNNLHGKFLQNTVNRSFVFEKNSDGVLEKKYAENYTDDWERSHFDYLRGALIYMRSNCRIINLYKSLKQMYSDIDLLYIDTDCLILQSSLGSFNSISKLNIISPYLGDYKIENVWTSFAAFGKKCYIGYNSISDKLKVVCAGLKPECIRVAITMSYDYNWLNRKEKFKYVYNLLINPDFRIEQKEIERVNTALGVTYSRKQKKFTSNWEEQL